MVEPVACAVHAVLAGRDRRRATSVAVLGAGTLGLAASAALDHLAATGRSPPRGRPGRGPLRPPAAAGRRARGRPRPSTSRPAGPGRAPATGSLASGPAGSGRGSPAGPTWSSTAWARPSRSASALAMVRPRGRVVLVGMPGRVHVDLAPLWHREVALVGAYAYGTERVGPGRLPVRRTFDLALEVVAGRPASAGWSRPPTRSTASRRPWPTPGRPAVGARSRWPSTSAADVEKGRADEPPARIRPRGRPLDPAHPVLARRAFRPRATARGQPGDLRPRAARRL